MSFIKKLFKQSDHKHIKIGKNSFKIPKNILWAYKSGDYYETNVIYWLNSILEAVNQPVFYDIGANYGFFTVKFADKCKQTYAFEPVSAVYQILAENIRKNRLAHIAPLNYGISDEEGERKINIYSSSGNNSLFERNIPVGHSLQFLNKETIQLKKLDNFVTEQNLTPPNVMKIDVEGAELQVLKSAEKTIKKYLPTIIIEYSENTSIDAGYKREDILSILQSLGNYYIYGLSEDYNDTSLISINAFEQSAVANIIASSKPLK
jgi:FkbM family methyltransferase